MSIETDSTGKNAPSAGQATLDGVERGDLLRGILATLGLIAGIEILSATAFHIPNAGPVTLLAVVYAAYTGGTRTGLISAALAVIYMAWNFSNPGEPFHFSPFNFNRLVVLLMVAPLMAIMVGTLRRRSRLYEKTAMANMALQAEVAERMALEQKHRELLQYQRALLDGIAERAWLKDADGRYLAVNRNFADLAGLSPDQMIGKTAADILPPDAVHRYEIEDREAMRSGKAFRTERASFLDDGATWREIIKVPVRSDDGRVVGLAVTTRDISARKQADAALKESEERFRQIAENIREIFWIGDRYFKKMLYVSPAFEEIWGMPLFSIYRNPLAWKDRVHPGDLAVVADALDKQSKGKGFDAEFRIIRSDGMIRWIRSRSFPYTSRGEEFVTGIAEDITDLKHAEEERLAHALKQRDTLVREVHHRIKNNLQAMAGLLMREAYEHPELGPLLKTAIAQVQLVALAHGIQADTTHGGILLCEITPAIARIVESLTDSRIAINVMVDMPHAVQIRERESVPIALILNELLINAVKHTPGDVQVREVEVTISRENDTILVRIFNRGSLPPGSDFAAGIGSGTGLGLVRSLMPRQGAELSLRSVNDGVEAILHLSAPVIEPSTRSPFAIRAG